jgi:hypothetical protein
MHCQGKGCRNDRLAHEPGVPARARVVGNDVIFFLEAGLRRDLFQGEKTLEDTIQCQSNAAFLKKKRGGGTGERTRDPWLVVSFIRSVAVVLVESQLNSATVT